MPTCPNCGSYVPLGNHSCSCGTTIGSRDDEYLEEMKEMERLKHQYFLEEQRKELMQRRKENPYKQDFLNDLYHEGAKEIYLERMDEGISEIEEKFSAKFNGIYFHNSAIFFKFLVETEYYDAIIRACYDISYAYNYVELITDIVTPYFDKLYSNQDFRNLVKMTESKINAKFRYCEIVILGKELVVYAYFENRRFFLDVDNMVLS